MTETNWRKSTYSSGQGDNCVEIASTLGQVAVRDTTSRSSGQGGECVEVATPPGRVAVRDTTNRDGKTLAFTADAWQAFVTRLK